MTRKARRVWALSRCYGPNFLFPEKQPKLAPVFKHHPAFCPVLRRFFLEHASLEPPLFVREVHLELPPVFPVTHVAALLRFFALLSAVSVLLALLLFGMFRVLALAAAAAAAAIQGGTLKVGSRPAAWLAQARAQGLQDGKRTAPARRKMHTGSHDALQLVGLAVGAACHVPGWPVARIPARRLTQTQFFRFRGLPLPHWR